MKSAIFQHLPLTLLFATALPAALSAQEAEEPVLADRQDPENLDPLLVTAEADAGGGYRREQLTSSVGFRDKAIINTPFSVAAFPSELIEDQQARTLLDVTKNDPSITPAADPLWFDRINVRGFYLGVDAVSRDGLSINDQGSIALENKEAIVVIKGPTATRNGATSPGGALNYVLKRPADEPINSLTAGFDSFGGYGASADFSRRFGAEKQYGMRFNFAGEEIRSFIGEVEGDRQLYSGAFDWRATDRLLLEFEFERHDREISTAQSPGLSSFSSLQAARDFFPRLNAETRPTQPWAVEPNEQTYYSGRATFDINEDWRVKVAAQEARLSRDQRSVRALKIQPNGDYKISHYFGPDQERNNTAWRAVLEGDFTTGNFKHEAAFGYDYIERDMIYGDAFSGVIGTGNLFKNSDIPNPNPEVDPSYLAYRNRQHSFFFSDTISITECFQVFGGARYTQIDTWDGEPEGLTKSYDDSEITPTYGVVYKPLPTLSIYGSYSEGIEQGGTAPEHAVNANEILGPLKTEQLEAGVKYELPGGALLTTALFQIDKGLEYTDDTNTYVQDGRQVHEGVEVTLAGAVTSRLSMVAGVAYLKPEIEETADVTLIGKQPQGVPQWQANLFANYDLSDFVPGLSINGGIYYSGEKAIDRQNTWMAEDYVRLDAGLRYEQRFNDTTNVIYRLTVENLADETYLANTTFGTLNFGSPRSVILSATVDF